MKNIENHLNKNRAENLFQENIGKIIEVELIPHADSGITFRGELIDIFCNTFIIKTNSDLMEMFRYEDVRFLRILRGGINNGTIIL